MIIIIHLIFIVSFWLSTNFGYIALNPININCCTILKTIRYTLNSFNWSLTSFLKYIQSHDNNLDLSNYKFSYLRKFKFKLTYDQFNQIKSYNSLFGTKIDGISRTLSRVYIKKLFRKYEKNKIDDISEFAENNSRRWGGGLESI